MMEQTAMKLYLLFGWYDGDTIQASKLFGIFSSVEAANKLRDKYVNTNVRGFCLQHAELDKEIVPTLESRRIYTVVHVYDESGGTWRTATPQETRNAS